MTDAHSTTTLLSSYQKRIKRKRSIMWIPLSMALGVVWAYTTIVLFEILFGLTGSGWLPIDVVFLARITAIALALGAMIAPANAIFLASHNTKRAWFAQAIIAALMGAATSLLILYAVLFALTFVVIMGVSAYILNASLEPDFPPLPEHICVNCEYDLRGTPDYTCPECGHPITESCRAKLDEIEQAEQSP